MLVAGIANEIESETENIMSKTIIKSVNTITAEGVSFTLSGSASLNGGLSTKEWYVSWDAIGKALFREQYSDAQTVKELDGARG